MYHHVVPAGEVENLAPFAVSHQLFPRQMDWLQQAGFRTTSLEQLFDAEEGNGGSVSRGKPIIITFDDCSADLMNYAVPELLKRGMTATFFAIAGKMGGCNEWDTEQGAPGVRLMSGKDLRYLAEKGFEIGSHGAVSIFFHTRTVTGDPFCMRRVIVHDGDQQIRFRFKLSQAYQFLRVSVDRRVLRKEKRLRPRLRNQIN